MLQSQSPYQESLLYSYGKGNCSRLYYTTQLDVASSGMANFRFEDTKPTITNDQLLADLRRVAAALDTETLSVRDYNEQGKFSSAAVKVRFGSWNRALIAARLIVSHQPDIPVEELWDNLREVWIRLGRQPRKAEMSKPLSRFTHNPYTKRWGSWLAAMRTFASTNELVGTDTVHKTDGTRTEPRGSRTASLRMRFDVMRRDRFRCNLCGRSPASTPGLELHVDHIIPWSQGGVTAVSNLQTLCSDCNLGKSDTI